MQELKKNKDWWSLMIILLWGYVVFLCTHTHTHSQSTLGTNLSDSISKRYFSIFGFLLETRTWFVFIIFGTQKNTVFESFFEIITVWCVELASEILFPSIQPKKYHFLTVKRCSPSRKGSKISSVTVVRKTLVMIN